VIGSLRTLNAWLGNPNGAHVFFLGGEPGSGKSTVAARLVQMSTDAIPSTNYPLLGERHLAFFHFCQAQVDTSLAPQGFVEALALALAERFQVYAKALTGIFELNKQAIAELRTRGIPVDLLDKLEVLVDKKVAGEEDFLHRLRELIGDQEADHYARMILERAVRRQTRSLAIEIKAEQVVGSAASGAKIKNVVIESLQIGQLSARVAFDQIIRTPLEVLCTSDFKETILILVDGLDEALTYAAENIVTLLGDIVDHPKDLPVQVRFLLASRPDPRVKHAIGEPSLHLIDDAPDDVDDVQTYVYHRLQTLPEARRSALTALIAQAGRGNFLYARYVLDDLLKDAGWTRHEAELTLPDGLSDVYRQFLKRELGRTLEQWSERYGNLLGVVSVARGDGLTREQLANITGLPQSQTDDILRVCSQYLTSTRPAGPLRIYHESFREFLLSDERFVYILSKLIWL
jgi:hypothetical protein